jgi:predicted  nucleic acid-binding Zn-ribbon protein
MRIKKCIKCSEQFETDKMGNICRACVSVAAKAWYYKNKAEGTLRYQKRATIRELPLQTDRWKELRAVKAEMRACQTREERRAFYGKMFDKIFQNKPLWEYIIRFGDDHIPKNNQKKKQLKKEEDGA